MREAAGAVIPGNQPPRRWLGVLAAAGWCCGIFATSCTVILPHDFFNWIARNLLTEPAAYRQFVVLWGFSWFAIVKGWHAAEFAILFALCLSVMDRLTGAAARRNVLASLAVCLLFAISDEYHQTFVPGRGGTVADVAIDGLGVFLASLIPWRRRSATSAEAGETELV
jgi:hypothetical protein